MCSAQFGVDDLAVHQRPMADPQRRRRICRARAARHPARPDLVDDFSPYLSGACKIVGASSDAALLQRCEAAMQQALGTQATAVALAKLLSRRHAAGPRQGHLRRRRWPSAWALRPTRSPPSATWKTICRCSRRSGLSFAMGNAADDIKTHGHACHRLERGRRFCEGGGDDLELTNRLEPPLRSHTEAGGACAHFDRCTAGFSAFSRR